MNCMHLLTHFKVFFIKKDYNIEYVINNSKN